MKCSVKGCANDSCGQPSGSLDVKLCGYHWNRWGDFHTGYECGHYGDEIAVRHGRLSKKRWEKAMKAFLNWCEIEISACEQIARAYVNVAAKGGP
jgi:hypothetical protein